MLATLALALIAATVVAFPPPPDTGISSGPVSQFRAASTDEPAYDAGAATPLIENPEVLVATQPTYGFTPEPLGYLYPPRFSSSESWDRATIIALYLNEFGREEPPMGFTGDVANCDAGTVSPAFRHSVLQRVNWYRYMAGLESIVENPSYSVNNQQAALLMAAEGRLSHSPSADWRCHTPEAEASAAVSSLALCIGGTRAIDAYMADFGENNIKVGHRRTMLYPQTLEMGVGNIPKGSDNCPSNTMQIFDDNLWAERPPVPNNGGLVSWPPPGYVPPETVWTRWSVSLAETDFSQANVTVEGPNGFIPVEIIARVQSSTRSAPESSLVWAVNNTTDSVPFLPVPEGGDDCYKVTVTGMKTNAGVALAPVVYTTCLLDLTMPTVEPPAPLQCPVSEFSAWTTPCFEQPGAEPIPFWDVPDGVYYTDPVAWMVANDITQGISPTEFGPDLPVSRAQAMTFIWRAAGEPAIPPGAPEFDDVPPGSYFYTPVRWAAANGITRGMNANEFGPYVTATRAHLVTFLWRLVDEPPAPPHDFVDVFGAWQQPGVSWAAAADVTRGISDTEFAPDRPVTRGQAATFIYRLFDALTNP